MGFGPSRSSELVLERMTDSDVINFVCRDCEEQLVELGVGFSPVVAAWPGVCPECCEDGGIFLVRADGHVSVLCPGCHSFKELGIGGYWQWGVDRICSQCHKWASVI